MWIYLNKVLPDLTGQAPGEGQFLFPHFPGQTVDKDRPNYLNVQVLGIQLQQLLLACALQL